MRQAGDGTTFIIGAAVLMAGLVIATMLTINAKLENALAPHAASGGDPSLKVAPVTPAPPLQVIAAPVAPVTATDTGGPLPDQGATLPAPAVAQGVTVTVTASPNSSAGPARRVAKGNAAASRPANTPAPAAAPPVSRADPAPVVPPAGSAPSVAASPPVAAVGASQSDIGDPAASRGEVNGGIGSRQHEGHHHFDREDRN